jgi:LPXTG-site transpeptidase (sortase) family protein
MVGTAQIFHEEYLGPVPAVVKGFAPITTGPQDGHAPPLTSRPASSTRPAQALVSPVERGQRPALMSTATAPVTATVTASATVTATAIPFTSFLPVIQSHGETLSSEVEPSTQVVQPVADLAPLDPPGAEEPSAAPAASEPVAPVVPDWIDIPAIDLAAPVVNVQAMPVRVSGLSLQQWSAPNFFAGGWHDNSALLGQAGNTVINGHHNIYGSVFARLNEMQTGDHIIVWGAEQAFFYEVDQVLLLEERYAGLPGRTENARWILPSDDERMTLVTCWPPESNTHRLIVVARPIP